MNRTDLAKHGLLILAGLIVLMWTLYLMVSPLKFALGLTLFLITVVVGEMLLSVNMDQLDTGIQGKRSGFTHRISGELVIVAVFTLSLAIIYLVPAIKAEIFVEWSALKLSNVVRLIAAFGLNFFPGYLVLAIVGRPQLDRLQKLVTSYLLSFFILTITGFVSAQLIGIVDDFFLGTFLLVSIGLILVYVFKHLLHRKPKLEGSKASVSSPTNFRSMLPALVVVLAITFMGIWLWWMYSSIGFFIGAPGTDMWRHHHFAQTFLDYKAFRWLHVPWWFYLYLACFTILSGAPSVNAYMALYPLIVLPVLSFYVMVSSFSKDKRIASIATLSYAIFSGPAWLYALYLRNFASVISYDNWVGIIFKTGDKFLYQGWYPSFVIGFHAAIVAFASLWWLMYATWRLDLAHKFNFFLVSITLAMSYLIHGIEPIVFVVYVTALLIVCLLTQNLEGKKKVRWVALSVVAGLGIVALIDISLTPQYEYFNRISFSSLASTYYYFNSPSFYAIAFSSVLIIALTYGKFVENRLMQLYHLIYKRVAPKYVSSVKRRLVEIMFYLYGLALIVFIVLFPSLTVATTGLGRIPWYIYPVITGVPSFLGLVGLAIVLLRWNRLGTNVRDALVFCALSIIMLFILGKVTSFINEVFFYTGFWERRTLSYITPMISILMAYAIVTLLSHGRQKESLSVKYLARIGMVSFLTSLIILSSVSSTLISGDFASRVFFTASLTNEELEALRYLHYSLPKGFQTAYISRRTGADYIRIFASDKWTEDHRLWLGQFYYSPSSVLSSIRQADIRFLYINRIRDSQDLNKNLFLQQLIQVLPVVFNNTEVTIYSIPPLHSPSQLSSLGLISPKETEGPSYDAYVLWFFTLMMSKYSYKEITSSSDPVFLNTTETVIMPYDPLLVEGGQLLEWVSKGGHLIVSNTNPYGVASELFGLTSKVSLSSCDSIENWKPLVKRGEIFLDTSLKVEGAASLRLQNNKSSWEEWVYNPPTPWDISRYEYLGIWVYGTGGGPIWYLYLTDSNGDENYFRYDLSVFDYETRTYVPSFTGWKLHLIPIKECYGHLDLSTIKKLRIVTGSQLPVNILIDEIFVLEESEKRFSVLANGISGTVNIDLPSIEVEALSPSKDARLVANYTENGLPVAPFAIQKDFDSGKVTYLNINSIYQSILSERSHFASPHETLAKILNLIGIKAPP